MVLLVSKCDPATAILHLPPRNLEESLEFERPFMIKTMSILRPNRGWTLALALCAVPASAQGPDMFGISAAGLGDVDGDGKPDLAVGDPGHSKDEEWSGRVWIVSGATWRPLRAIDGAAGQEFGVTLAAPGDLDGDGIEDLLVGSTPKDLHARVGAFSAATGESLYELELPAEDRMHVPWYSSARGPALAAIGDVDGDGRGDFVVGVPLDDGAAPHAGLVQGRSGADGALLFELRGRADCDRFGISVAAVGDLDGDGKQDAIAGAMPELEGEWETEGACAYRAGYAVIFSGANGKTLRVIESPDGSRRFGVAVAGIGDLDRDGTPDVAVSSTFYDFDPQPMASEPTAAEGEPELVALRVPEVKAFSGASGSLLRTWKHGAEVHSFGAQLLGLGDVDGDKVPDVLITAPKSLFGSGLDVALWLGASSGPPRPIPSDGHDWSGTHRGVSAARVGDFDGDGHRDLAICAASVRAGGSIPGLLYVHSTETGEELARLSRAELQATPR